MISCWYPDLQGFHDLVTNLVSEDLTKQDFVPRFLWVFVGSFSFLGVLGLPHRRTNRNHVSDIQCHPPRPGIQDIFVDEKHTCFVCKEIRILVGCFLIMWFGDDASIHLRQILPLRIQLQWCRCSPSSTARVTHSWYLIHKSRARRHDTWHTSLDPFFSAVT